MAAIFQNYHFGKNTKIILHISLLRLDAILTARHYPGLIAMVAPVGVNSVAVQA